MENNNIDPKDLVKGIHVSLRELRMELLQGVDDMTTKQLRRSLESTVRLLGHDPSEGDRDISALSDSEKKFLGGLIALIKNSQALHVYEVAEEQRNRDEGEE